MARFFKLFIIGFALVSPLILSFLIIFMLLLGTGLDIPLMTGIGIVAFSFASVYAIVHSISHIRDGESDEQRLLRNVYKGLRRKSLLFRAAVRQLNEMQLNDALEGFQAVKEMKLSDAERRVLMFYLGRCYHLMGYSTNAAVAYDEAIRMGFDEEIAYVFAARCEILTGGFEQALDYYNILIGRNTELDYIYTDIGMLYLKRNDAQRALETFEKSIELKRNVVFARGGCALAYLLLDRPEESRRLFETAVLNGDEDVDGFKTYYNEVAEAHGMKIVRKGAPTGKDDS